MRLLHILAGVEDGCVHHINNFAETEKVLEAVKRSDCCVPADATLCLSPIMPHSSNCSIPLLLLPNL